MYCEMLFILITVMIPIVIWLKYGREEFHEKGIIYQREPPTDDHPVIVNAVCCDYKSPIGWPTEYGFKAGMYHLVEKGFLEFLEYDKNIIFNLHIKRFDFKINYEFYQTHKDQLTSFEVCMIEIFERLGTNGVVQFNKVHKNVFSLELKAWQLEVQKYFIENNLTEKYYDSTGKDIILRYFIFLIIFGAGVIIYCILVDLNPQYFMSVFILEIYLFCLAITCMGLPDGVFGKWTEYGRDYRERWERFGEFLKDFTIIDEYCPKYMKLWNEYWVYSIAIEMNKQAPPAIFWSDELIDEVT